MANVAPCIILIWLVDSLFGSRYWLHGRSLIVIQRRYGALAPKTGPRQEEVSLCGNPPKFLFSHFAGE